MGQLFSGPYHRAELQMRKTNPILDYQPQPGEEVVQLDTEADQRGNTTVDHVFKMTREVYGQKATDLKLRIIDWREYNIDLKNRPSPYDFPAFEHEERLQDPYQATITNESVTKAAGNSEEKTANSSPSNKQKPDSKGEKLKKAKGDKEKRGKEPKATELKVTQSKVTQSKAKESKATEQVEKPKKSGTEKERQTNIKDPQSKKSARPKRTRVSHNQEMDRCSLEE